MAETPRADAPPNPPVATVSKSITIVMPFDEHDVRANRLYKLLYQRLKYIIVNKINYEILKSGNPEARPDPQNSVKWRGKPCQFKVKAVVARPNATIQEIMEPITDSDVTIGFLGAMNVHVAGVTVIYELAIRHVMRRGLVLVVDGDPEELRPRFMKDLIHIVLTASWMDVEEFTKLAQPAMPSTHPSDKSAELPIEAGIDQFDDDLPDITQRALELFSDVNDENERSSLRNALQSVMDDKRQQSDAIRKLWEDLDPEFMVHTAHTYYASVVYKVTWSGKPRDQQNRVPKHTEADMLEQTLCDWNHKFLELFNMDNYNRADGPLNAQDLLKSLEHNVEEADFLAFMADQKRLYDLIRFGPESGAAQIPIRFNDNHPNKAYRGKIFLPCCVLKKTIGSPEDTHYTYMLVIWFDITDSSDVMKIPITHEEPLAREPQAAQGRAPAVAGTAPAS